MFKKLGLFLFAAAVSIGATAGSSVEMCKAACDQDFNACVAATGNVYNCNIERSSCRLDCMRY